MLLPKRGKNGKKSVVDYNGPRTASGIIAQAKYYLPNYVKTISKRSTEDVDSLIGKIFDSKNQKSVSILFTDKKETSMLWKKLAAATFRKMTLYTVDSEQTGITERFKVSKFPTILVFPKGSDPENFEIYTGKYGVLVHISWP